MISINIKKGNLIGLVILLISMIIFIFLLYVIFYLAKNIPIFGIDRIQYISGDMISGDIISGKKIEHQKVILLENTGFWDKNSFSTNFFPKIKINRLPENLTLVANIDFDESFKKQYPDIVDSPGYGFAIRFFIDTLDNGGFYNVFRKTNGGVGNDYPKGLTGWIPGKDINGGFIRKIPLNRDIPIAVDFEKVAIGYQFTYINTLNYLNNKIGKETILGVYLSSVSGIPGRKLMYIKELSIEYDGYENDIEFLNN